MLDTDNALHSADSFLFAQQIDHLNATRRGGHRGYPGAAYSEDHIVVLADFPNYKGEKLHLIVVIGQGGGCHCGVQR